MALWAAGLYAAGLLAIRLFPAWLAMRFPWDATLARYVTSAPFARWDSYWYATIANGGYEWMADGKPHNVVFYPLYPILLRVFERLTGIPTLYCGELLSFGLLLAAALVIGRLAALDGYETRETLAVMLAFPTAFFFLAVYSESLFLLCTAAFFLALRKKAWWVVSATGVLAGLARPTGLVLILPLAASVIFERRDPAPLPERAAKRYVALASPLIGLSIFSAICLVRFGQPLLFVTARKTDWHFAAAWPWWLAAAALRNQNGRALEALTLLLFAAAGLSLWKRHRDYALYVLGSLLVFAEGNNVISSRRYVLVLFPAFFEISRWLRKSRLAFGAYLAASSIALVYLTARFALGFWVD